MVDMDGDGAAGEDLICVVDVRGAQGMWLCYKSDVCSLCFVAYSLDDMVSFLEPVSLQSSRVDLSSNTVYCLYKTHVLPL